MIKQQTFFIISEAIDYLKGLKKEREKPIELTIKTKYKDKPKKKEIKLSRFNSYLKKAIGNI